MSDDMMVVVGGDGSENRVKNANIIDGKYVNGLPEHESWTSDDYFLVKHQSTLRLTKSVLAVVVDSGATSKRKGRQL